MTRLELTPSMTLSTADVASVAHRRCRVEVSVQATEAMQVARDLLIQRVEQGALIYGVTTGFGPLATTHLDPQHALMLQNNLVYHLASGVGEPLSDAQVRAMMLIRAVSLCRGYSAVRPDVVACLCAWLNSDYTPVVPSMGTVGASGDLTPLAHMVLGLMGEGVVRHRDGRIFEGHVPDFDVLKLGHKEGLALVNGTSAMTAIAALNGEDATQILKVAVWLTSVFAQALSSQTQAWDEIFERVRPHAGQRRVRRWLSSLIEGATRTRGHVGARDVDRDGVGMDRALLQDAYSIRCAPQLLGAVDDAMSWHRDVVHTEMASVTDNPLIDPKTGEVYHGGNFFGQHVAFASDALRNALVQVATLVERQLAWVTDASRTALPPFLTGGRPGLCSGLMGAQVTASAVVAELRARAGVPASIQSIPTNANNQDVVPMGTIAARSTAWAITHVWDVLAIGALAATQAMSLLGPQTFNPQARQLYEVIRRHSAPLDVDRPLSSEIALVARALKTIDVPVSNRSYASGQS